MKQEKNLKIRFLNNGLIFVKNYYKYKNICFLHGNKLWKEYKKCKILVIGHLHPAVIFCDNYKNEKYKCFLKGKWKKKEVYILPSFVPLNFGYDLNDLESLEDNFSFIGCENLKKFEVIVYNNLEYKEYNFGKLGKLIKDY